MCLAQTLLIGGAEKYVRSRDDDDTFGRDGLAQSQMSGTANVSVNIAFWERDRTRGTTFLRSSDALRSKAAQLQPQGKV